MNAPFYAGIAFSIFGLYFLRYALVSYRDAIESNSWSKIQGKLIESHLWGTRNIKGEMVAVEKLSVKYEYTVNEALHSGERVSFYTLVYPETTEFSQHNTVGEAIEVYYNPKNPKESVLIPGPREDKPFSDIIIATGATLLGVALSVAGFFGIL